MPYTKENDMKKNRHTSRAKKAAVAVTLLGTPMFATPGFVYGQKADPASTSKASRSVNMYLKFTDVFEKYKGDLYIAGVGEGHTIYEKSNGDMFYIDTETGNMKPVSSKVFMKVENSDKRSSSGNTYIKFDGIKGESKVKILGVDANGNVVHQKENGDKFTVNLKTGHVTLIK